MSSSEARGERFNELTSEIAALGSEAIEECGLASIGNDALGQLFATVVRVYAAKAQIGPAPFPFARNAMVTQTDVAISCTAMLDGVGMQVFELGMWQDMSGIGRLAYEGSKSGGQDE